MSKKRLKRQLRQARKELDEVLFFDIYNRDVDDPVVWVEGRTRVAVRAADAMVRLSPRAARVLAAELLHAADLAVPEESVQ